MKRREQIKQFGLAVGIGVCYFSAGKLGLAFAIPPGSATVIWPPSGIAAATLLLMGCHLWPVVWVASCLLNLTTHISLLCAACFATGNTIEAVLAACLLRRFLPSKPFLQAKDAFTFMIVAASSCLPAATVGAFTLLMTGRIDSSQLSVDWSTWFLGDLFGQVVMVPLCLALAGKRWAMTNSTRILELLLLFSIQVILSFLLFGGLLSERLAGQVLYLPMVLMVWCSLRFGLAQVTVSTLLFSIAAVWGTWAGVGAYGLDSPHSTLFDLQLLLLTYALTSLVVSSIVASQKQALSESSQSQRQLRQETMERSRVEKWFEQMLKASPDALIMSDRQGKIVLVNESTELLFGYSSEELVGQPIEILVPPSLRYRHREHREQYYQSPYPRRMGAGLDLTAFKKDGMEFAAEITLGPTETPDGLVVFSAVRDVTENKKSQKALQDSEERFALAVQGTDAGIWDWDLRTDEVYFSPRWKSILGYSENEIQDHFNEWQSRLHPEDRDRALRTVQEYLDGKLTDYELEHRLRHKDGSYRWILARGAVFRDASGRPYRMAGSHLDITEHKMMEQKLRIQMAQLIAAGEIQSQFLPEESPQIPGLDIAGRCYPAEFAAGDYFDYLFLKDGSFVTVISDVCGHGVGPAILMASLHSHLRSLSDTSASFSAILERVNNIMMVESSTERFVTLLATILDFKTRTMTYFRCGHPPGFVMNSRGDVRMTMEGGGLPLGIVSDTHFHRSTSIELQSGDLIVMVTDGLLEAFSPEGVQFGMDRTISVVGDYRNRSASQIIEAVREDIRDYTGQSELSDDLTMVVIKVT